MYWGTIELTPSPRERTWLPVAVVLAGCGTRSLQRVRPLRDRRLASHRRRPLLVRRS